MVREVSRIRRCKTLFLALSTLMTIWCAVASAADRLAYRNNMEKFEFEYPAGYALKESKTPQGELVFILLGRPSGQAGGWLLDVGIEEADETLSREMAKWGKDAFRKYAFERAMRGCDADGPDESVYCSEVVREAPFEGRGGFKGYELYLK